MKLQCGIIALGCLPFAGDIGPGEPSDRRIEPGEMESQAIGIGRHRGGAPFAGLQHRGLVVFGDRLITALANVGGGLGLALLPAQTLEFEPLHMPAMRARHEEAALIAGLEFALDPGQTLDRRRRYQKHLGAVAEGPGAGMASATGSPSPSTSPS